MDIKEEEIKETEIFCEICGKNDKTTQREHNRLHHQPYQCDEAGCQTVWEGYIKFKNHRRRHVKKVVKKVVQPRKDIFVCEVCAESFSHQGLLKNHLKTHSPKFACKNCPEIYTTKRDLERHEKVHLPKKTKPKKFPCSICQAVLTSSYNLKRHKDQLHNKIVTSNGSFFLIAPGTSVKKRKKKNQTKICSNCGVKIAHSRNFKRHILSCLEKTGKLNKCKYCSYTSKFPFNVRRHMKTCEAKNALNPGVRNFIRSGDLIQFLRNVEMTVVDARKTVKERVQNRKFYGGDFSFIAIMM